MDAVLLLMVAQWALDALAVGISSIWVLVTIVSVVSLVVVIGRLIPRREY